MQQSGDPALSDDSIGTDDSDSDLASLHDMEENCEITGVVLADSTLFNGARQALARGASFGGLQGRGNASGRQFRLEVSIGMPTRKRSQRTTSALPFVYSQVGNRTAPRHDWSFQWYRSSFVGEKWTDDTVSQGGNDNREVEWIAVDGATAASFQPDATLIWRQLRCVVMMQQSGDPHDTKTILFRDEPATQLLSLMDDEASVSSASCASSSQSPRSVSKPDRGAESPGFFISPINTVATPSSSTPGSPDRSLVASPEIDTIQRGGMLEEHSLIAAMENEWVGKTPL
jgi:hypothetical protein